MHYSLIKRVESNSVFTKSYDFLGIWSDIHWIHNTQTFHCSYWGSLFSGGSWRAILTRCPGSSWSSLQREQNSCHNTEALTSGLKRQSPVPLYGMVVGWKREDCEIKEKTALRKIWLLCGKGLKFHARNSCFTVLTFETWARQESAHIVRLRGERDESDRCLF